MELRWQTWSETRRYNVLTTKHVNIVQQPLALWNKVLRRLLPSNVFNPFLLHPSSSIIAPDFVHGSKWLIHKNRWFNYCILYSTMVTLCVQSYPNSYSHSHFLGKLCANSTRRKRPTPGSAERSWANFAHGTLKKAAQWRRSKQR